MEDVEQEYVDPSISMRSSGGGQYGVSQRSGGNAASSLFLYSFKETKAVLLSKAFAYVVLFLAAIALSITTYVVNEKGEDEDFRKDFRSIAKEVVDVAEFNAFQTTNVLQDLVVATTSFILSANLTTPWFRIPHFYYRGNETRKLTGAQYVLNVVLVDADEQPSWETYAVDHQDWIREGLDYQGLQDVDPGTIPSSIQLPMVDETEMADGQLVFFSPQFPTGINAYLPVWQMDPAPTNASVVMQDLAWVQWFRDMALTAALSGDAVISNIVEPAFLLDTTNDNPKTVISFPYFQEFERQTAANAGGLIVAVIPWDTYFRNTLPDGADGLRLVINDGCGAEFTYAVQADQVEFLGYGALFDSKYSYLREEKVLSSFGRVSGIRNEEFTNTTGGNGQIQCSYSISVYPSGTFEDRYYSNEPIWYAVTVFVVFIITALIFVVYEVAVQKRQIKILSAAQKTAAILTSLFPKNVQQRILQEAEQEESPPNKGRKTRFGARQGLRQFLDEDEKDRNGLDDIVLKTKPIADLFPEVTIMFSDIVGFTAWSSTRDPSQVFVLLETIFHAFDQNAHNRKVFKVETVGDSYVAVAGLPDPRKDHAVVMAKFAQDCMKRMTELTKELEETLGPDTGELALRVGLHSGPVTAGVLRGEKARFQLFGDTMNTASRMETTGEKNRIQVSQETADLLFAAGKADWLHKRAGKIRAKGKGELTTYWLAHRSDGGLVRSSAKNIDPVRLPEEARSYSLPSLESNTPVLTPKMVRLVRWNTEVLSTLLKQIVARRAALGVTPAPVNVIRKLEQTESKTMVIDEVVDVITLPKFNARAAVAQQDPSSIELGDVVLNQLKGFIERIAFCYRENPFHNFEHVSHVTLSVVKLMGRIIAPDIEVIEQSSEKSLHDHTYGITSDPLTQFAVVFSALIHDVDHVGVPNAQLVRERAPVAVTYNNKSVAEQNSVDVAWKVLMDPHFDELRSIIYQTEEEFKRFRHLVVNCVMATDIIDKDLSEARKARWNKAFDSDDLRNSSVSVNRKATLVLEYLIQASDVAHTMQHWNIYRKWNKRLFEEVYKAYTQGRGDENPLDFWYEGELAFFDYYIIPLAQRLKDCGVFGVSCDEYFTYATQNRRQWEEKGLQIIAELRNKVYT